MKVIILKRRQIVSFLLFITIIAVSVTFTRFKNKGILETFKKDERIIPIYCVDTAEKKVAISFDAAWGSDYTEELLSILEKYNVKTTFFLVAFWIDKYPDMVKRIDECGHEIGNHSAKHPNMSQLSEERIKEELTITSNKIVGITGKKDVLFRPPFGDYNNRVMKTAKSLGYYVIQWDVDSLDYKDYGAKSITDRVLNRVKDGSIVLFHNNATYTAEALPVILESLQKSGYKIVPISELIYKDNYYVDHTGKQKQLN